MQWQIVTTTQNTAESHQLEQIEKQYKQIKAYV